MGSKSSSSLIICCMLSILILHSSTPQSYAARKLVDTPQNGNSGNDSPPGTVQMPPPTPVNYVTYISETQNGTHGLVVYVNGTHGQNVYGQSRSQSGMVHGKDGKPGVRGTNHTGSQTATVNNNGLHGIGIQASNISGTASGTISGSNGKPMLQFSSPPENKEEPSPTPNTP